jgi:hypothetical protein
VVVAAIDDGGHDERRLRELASYPAEDREDAADGQEPGGSADLGQLARSAPRGIPFDA